MADEEVVGFNTEEDYVGDIETTTDLIETVYGELDDNAGDDPEVEAVTGQTVSTINIDTTPVVLPEFEPSEFTDTSNTYTPEVGDVLAEYDDDEDDDPYTPELPNKISRETMTIVESIIGEVDAETISEYNDLSADVYAVFTDGTRKQVEWSDVFDPMGDVYSNVAIQGAVVSAAKNQHFWSDTNGVHITDDDEDSWNTEYAKQSHGSLSTPTVSKPWHNILLNSYGFLLRWGLLNLAQISKSSVAFYTGDGNGSSDILAMFGATQAQIGKSTEKHVVIDSNGVTAYNGDGTIAPMRAYLSGSYIDDSTITGSKIANSTITGSKIAGGTIENSNIKDGTITGGKIVGSTLTGIPQAAIVNLSADYAHITNGTIDNATINHADVNGLSATYATVNNLSAATGRISTLETNTADIATLRANSAKVANLTAQQLEAANAYIASLTAGNVTANDIIADTGKIHNLTAQQLSAAVGYIADLTAASITTTDLIADHGTIGSLDTHYAQINMANVNNAWITNGTVKDGAITNAMINSVSANKLTAGTIDASNITVTNLNADNITTGTINGQRIGTGSLSLDKLSDDVYTETEVDNLLATMQSEIDGAIETWTGTAVPTLTNAPASIWTSNSDKDKHVGDVYFVVNSQSQQNGYNYRFTKNGTGSSATYSWQLIKDTDITNALSRLSTAEGSITQFSSDISQLQTSTGTLTTKTTQLETSLGDKVDVTDFNDLEDTVDGHTQTLSQHTTAISSKADSSTVTSVTNRVSKNEQDISGINTTISSLTTTVNSKADSSTVTTISNQLNTVSNTVDGHTQTISSVQTTLNSKADSDDLDDVADRVSTAESTISQHTTDISLKANSADTYTKTQTDGLISTEVTDRNAAIQLASNAITSTVSETYATKTETSDAKTYVANAKANYGYQYMKNIVIYGESSKYYPVYFTNTNVGSIPQTVTHEIMIRREYSEQAPSDWYTSTHKGGLNIHFGWNFGGWGGATYKCEVYEFTQLYSTMVGDILVGADDGMFSIVYLRGGGTTGALYHVYSDVPFTRQSYMTNAGVVGANDVPFIGLEQGVKYAQYPAGDNPTYKWNVRAPLTEPNTAHLNKLYTVQRVITAETAIQQTANNVLIKATQSDTTAAQGGQHLIQSLINVAPSGVKIDASKVNITGDAVFSAINNDTGTTKISGGKIDATSITLGYSQITNPPAIPTKTSDLTNDSSYATTSQIPTKTSDLTNDSSYATTSQIPTKTSDLTNDSYYATTSQAQAYADAKDTAIAAAAKRTYVSIRATAVDYSANTATLEATLYIDGTATITGVSYKWFMDGTEISGATSRTYSVPASNGLNHAYSCKCTATV